MCVWEEVVLALFVLAAMFCDLRRGRIPNRLIIAGICCGFVCQCVNHGSSGLRDAIPGMLLPVLLFGWLFYFRMIGAGDIKLLGMAGVFLGPRNVCALIVTSLLTGGVLAVIILIRNRNVYSRFFYLQSYIREYLRTGKWQPYITDECRDGRIYFTVPVFLGLLLCYALRFQIL